MTPKVAGDVLALISACAPHLPSRPIMRRPAAIIAFKKSRPGDITIEPR